MNWPIKAGIALGVAALLIVAFYAEENGRGARAWAQAKKQSAAAGLNFNPQTFLPAPVPDSENFTQTESWKKWAATIGSDPRHAPQSNLLEAVKKLFEWKKKNKTENWLLGELPPAPPDDLFDGIDVELQQLHAAGERPACQYAIDYRNRFALGANAPHFLLSITLAQLTSFHALSALDNAQTDTAAKDLLICFRLAEGNIQNPTLISGTVALSEIQNALPALWKGIEKHEWSDSQLVEFQKQLGVFHCLRIYDRSVRGEIALIFLPRMDDLEENRFHLPQVLFGQRMDKVFYLVPAGWYDFARVKGVNAYRQFLTGIIDPEKDRFHPENSFTFDPAQGLACLNPTNWLLDLLFGSINTLPLRFAEAQSRLDLARVACVLERYWLVNQKYPATLGELQPQFIDSVPHDVCTGEPLHYRVEADGNYALYSVGFNRTDDGGKVATRKDKWSPIDTQAGDWVWPRSKP